jgi:ATP synthase protein I
MNESEKESLKSETQESKRKPNQLLRFSGMAVQMGATIGAGAWGGSLLDAKYQTEKPLWTLSLSLLGVFISLYLFIKQAKKLSDDS